ncbi:MAG: FAD-dependent monooxygenase [Elusimicrobia bacterium]|nr:FAD-dependent monooxygenase [Elusimicrobiota bacterium]
MRALPPSSCDVAVIGAGPAGSALAALLARRGRSVALLEKDVLPRDKLCGEFLSPEAQGALARIGCLDAVRARAPARMAEARLFPPRGRPATVPLGGEALGLSRAALDEVLFRHAAACGAAALDGTRARVEGEDGPGTEVVCGPGAEGTRVAARCVVAAWGRRTSGGGLAAVKRHHRPRGGAAGEEVRRALVGRVELHVFNGGYCGLSFVEGGVVNVCALLEPGFLRAMPAPRWEGARRALAAASPSLARRLEGLEPCSEGFLAVAGVEVGAVGASRGSLFLVGDAAGMIAPLCGDGMAAALESAERLAGLLEPPPATAEELRRALASWEDEWRAAFHRRLAWSAALQGLMARPALAGAAMAAVRRVPALGRALVRVTRGEG